MPHKDMDRSGRRTVRWFREPLVWLLIAIPGSAVVMGAVMLTLATSSYDGLVADDYYKRGLQINRSIARDRQASNRGITAQVRVAPGTIDITLAGTLPEIPKTLKLSFLHATRQGRDHVITLTHVGRQDYRADVGELSIDGNTVVRLETSNWRIGQRLHQPLEPQASFALMAEQHAG